MRGMKLHVQCSKQGEAPVELYCGEIHSRDKGGGVSLYLEEVVTPLGFKLSLEARTNTRDSSIGMLTVWSGQTELLCCDLSARFLLPSGETLYVSPEPSR
jgi:hypothetical protein